MLTPPNVTYGTLTEESELKSKKGFSSLKKLSELGNF